jgi:membrane fusion protein, multidrug efflux system
LELDWLVNTVYPRTYARAISGFALAAAVLLLCVLGCKSPVTPSTVAASETAQPHSEPAASTANADPPAPAAAPQFTAYGPLVAEQQADLAAQHDGRIVEIDAQIGDHVRAGQVLARLDDRMLQAACEAQKARIAAAQAQVRQWQDAEESARAEMRRADALHDAKILSDEDWEVAKDKLAETGEEVTRYQSEQAEGEANLAAASAQLEQSRIVAPFAGVVGRSSVRPDQQVKAGDILFWVTAEEPLRVLFTLPELAIRQLSVGTPLVLTTADYPGLHQRGHVVRLSPVIDPASASIQVVGAVDHPSPLLKPGMSMQVRLTP